jgi:hypothetical protein
VSTLRISASVQTRRAGKSRRLKIGAASYSIGYTLIPPALRAAAAYSPRCVRDRSKEFHDRSGIMTFSSGRGGPAGEEFRSLGMGEKFHGRSI